MTNTTNPDTPPEAPAAEDPITALAAEKIRAAFPDAIEAAELSGHHPSLRIQVGSLRAVAELLRDDPELRLDCCHLISGVDWPKEEEIEVVYHLVSYTVKPPAGYRTRADKNDPFVALRVRVPRDQPEVPTVGDVWSGADWHERETYDLMGVVFTGRGELRRILLPEDWPGHPLRKDWEFPVGYHGVPIIPPEAQ